MKFSTRLFNLNKDFSIIEEFCKQRNLEVIDKDMLSAYGVIVLQDDVPVVCGWLYPITTSKLCMIENVIGSKEIDNKKESIDLLFTTLHLIAKDLGYKYIKNTVSSESIKNRLESYGYMKIQDNLVNYMGVL